MTHVLVADDDEDMRQLVSQTLRNHGYEVDDVASSYDLLSTLAASAAGSVHAIVLDLRMPGLSGLEVLRRMRAANSLTPALLVTAFPDEETMQEAERLGATVLGKPFRLDALAGALASVVRGS